MRMRTGRLSNSITSRGFTLLELIIVIAVIGILATAVLPNLKNIPRRASEAVLRQDLQVFREAIDQYRADKGYYPSTLETLVEEDYIRRMPVDPFTQSAESWILIREEVDPDFLPAETEFGEESEPGIEDVRSGAPGESLDGTPFIEF
jgi:general secretion pathway protein G